MNPSVYCAVLKHIGVEGFETAILHYIIEQLEFNGYKVEFDEDEYTDEIFDIRYFDGQCCVQLKIDFVGEKIELHALAHVNGFAGNIQTSFYDKFEGLKNLKGHLFPFQFNDQNLLNMTHEIYLKDFSLNDIIAESQKFKSLIDKVSSQISQKAVFLSFFNDNELDTLKYGI